MEVFVIRHTMVAVLKEFCYGQTDVALSDTFESEWTALKDQLPTDFDAVFSSPLMRCQLLAQKISDNIETDKRLIELNFGDWEMQKWAAIDSEALNAWMYNFVSAAPPNGESLAALNKRVHEFMDDLRQKKGVKKVILVAHSGVIRCIWAYLLEIPLNNIFKLPVGFGEILRFKLGETAAFDVIKRMK